MKFVYYNDTKREVSIHPATFSHGCSGERGSIQPLEMRMFTLPEGTYPWVKMWDYGELGLSLLISPNVEEGAEPLVDQEKEIYIRMILNTINHCFDQPVLAYEDHEWYSHYHKRHLSALEVEEWLSHLTS